MVVRLGDEFRVDPRNGLYAEIKAELDPEALLTWWRPPGDGPRR
jgi:hypothetical protein